MTAGQANYSDTDVAEAVKQTKGLKQKKMREMKLI